MNFIVKGVEEIEAAAVRKHARGIEMDQCHAFLCPSLHLPVVSIFKVSEHIQTVWLASRRPDASPVWAPTPAPPAAAMRLASDATSTIHSALSPH